MEIIITPETAGQKLLKFLIKNFSEQPKAYWYKAARTGRILLNDKKPKELKIELRENDRVEVKLPEDWENKILKTYDLRLKSGPLNIIYEDEYLMVVNKPAGLAVHGGTKHVGDNLINRIKSYLKVPAESRVPAPINRLDLETSGLMLIGKTQSSVVALGKIFSGREVKKEYYALVHADDFSFADGTIREDIIEGKEGKEKVVSRFIVSPATREKDPATKELGEGSSWGRGLRTEILTGKTHQIRKQLKLYNAVIIGDTKYGDFALNRKLKAKRMMLHSALLEFTHPFTGKKLSFNSPPPPWQGR